MVLYENLTIISADRHSHMY